MKLGFVVPIMADADVEKTVLGISKACNECKASYEIIFAINNKCNNTFTKIREVFIENNKVKAFKVDKQVDEHKLITLAMKYCEKYDATIIYSAKEDVNIDVIKAFVTSWQAGNQIVYLKKVYFGIKKIWQGFMNLIYRLGTKVVGVYKDMLAENDIQLLDLDVVKTINGLPAKNQQLRVLDSFVGYKSDVIHLEVDSRVKTNPEYAKKSKQYKLLSAISIITLILFVASLTISIIALSLQWNWHVAIHITLWFVGIVSIVISLILYTRKRLGYRAGSVVDSAEIKSLNDRVEKYNM